MNIGDNVQTICENTYDENEYLSKYQLQSMWKKKTMVWKSAWSNRTTVSGMTGCYTARKWGILKNGKSWRQNCIVLCSKVSLQS